jgi:hypothetical protein
MTVQVRRSTRLLNNMHRQTKTLPEETNLFVQEPSSSHAEFQINENNQDNTSSACQVFW